MNTQELIEYYQKKTYIGDGVYIYFDGYHFILETWNGVQGNPSNRIALEPPVIENLLNYRKQLYSDFEDLKNKEKNESNS